MTLVFYQYWGLVWRIKTINPMFRVRQFNKRWTKVDASHTITEVKNRMTELYDEEVEGRQGDEMGWNGC